jgi:hypothetical protein
MPRQIARYLTATGGVANMDGTFEVEMGRDSRQVVGIMIHIVAVGGLSRAAVATAIMSDHPIAVTKEEQHLVIPIVGAEWPTMAENYRLSRAPIFVINLGTVFGGDSGHEVCLLTDVWSNRGVLLNTTKPISGQQCAASAKGMLHEMGCSFTTTNGDA